MDTVTQVTDDQCIPCQPDLPHADLAAPREEEPIASDIALNWKAYRNLQRSVKKSHKKLPNLGKSLGESMYRLKLLLAKPGCTGNWSAFLRENEVSRTTADRLIGAYERSLNPGANCTVGAIQPLTQDAVHKLCVGVWSHSKKKLTSYESVYWFFCEMAGVPGA